jgi:hypothetical protein
MLHTGVCVPRQYARFCDIVYGENTRSFFAKLVRLHYASMYDCRHNRARIYHLNQRALYATIGEADSRLRKPVTLNHAIQRLMVLDAIVEDPDLVWLGTADEKAAHVLALTRIAEMDLPHVTVGDGERRRIRYFPDRLPIGIHLAGRGVVVYVVTDQRSTTSGSSSNATAHCSARCQHGRSGPWFRRSSRTWPSARNRSSGTSS